MTAAAVAVSITGVHPYADKFPMLPEGELVELSGSIRANGLRSPIVLTPDGLILDGRNRFAACQQIGAQPETVVYDGDDLAEYVIDANSTRRNMTTGARAMATAMVLAADGRRKDGRWRRDSLPAIGESPDSSTWVRALRDAGIVLDHAPDLAQQVVVGDLALDAAYKQAIANRDAERNKLAEVERLAAEEADAATFIEQSAIPASASCSGTPPRPKTFPYYSGRRWLWASPS